MIEIDFQIEKGGGKVRVFTLITIIDAISPVTLEGAIYLSVDDEKS